MRHPVGVLVGTASRLTGPAQTERVEDPVIGRMQGIRTALGLVATLWLLFAYPLRGGRQSFVLGKLEELLIGCGIVLVAAVVGVGGFIVLARAPLGRMYAGRVFGPLLALGAIPVGVGLVWLMVLALGGDIVSWDDIGPHDFTFGLFGTTLGTIITGLVIGLLFIVAALACVVGLLAALCFTLVAVVTGMNSCFRTGDVHELLPPLLSPLLVWALFVLQLFDDADVAAPPFVLYVFSIGGPLSVTLLSVWEVRRLRVRYGVTLRTALGR
ncbi:hypothetical protein Q5762_28670 [Streptomyces sp. P9(2023)]|uniref:hypothetical protein n=1 Tax=Streptomyces sp. P9(2023) TaxID=3064394 RepID=UPI0028F3E446|nr:hypothetical protein [Streptomyces sp. P9(2023)]MDT9692232.1 hypothetical protein [Streptomyces sp. P9(2023)]